MNANCSSKATSRIAVILLIAVLFISITLSIFAWNYGLLGSQSDEININIPFEEPSLPQSEPSPEIPDEENDETPTIPEKSNEPINPPQLPEEPEIPNEPEEPLTPTQPENPETPTEPNEPEEPTEPEQPTQHEPNENSTTPTRRPEEWATVGVGGEVFYFDPSIVNTTRPDLFNEGQFSMFDVLAHLGEQKKIDLEYHFDASLNTQIIDSINNEPNWWYQTFYEGGWPEENVYRPDHYQWKGGTTLSFFQTRPSMIEGIYSVWRKEIVRLENNSGTIIIPEVIIRGEDFTKVFTDVEVAAHNLRDDVFLENVTTTIDVIMSLGDQGKISYELQWYEFIGTVNTVQSYWVEAINDSKAGGTCGFVYEAGSIKYHGFNGNHIHLPSDVRIINSPEYVEFYWICL